MSRIGLTPQERQLVRRIAESPVSASSRIASYAFVVLPALVFGGYGVYRSDRIASAIGLAVLGAFFAWAVRNQITYARIYKELFRKVDAYERRSSEAYREPAKPQAGS